MEELKNIEKIELRSVQKKRDKEMHEADGNKVKDITHTKFRGSVNKCDDAGHKLH